MKYLQKFVLIILRANVIPAKGNPLAYEKDFAFKICPLLFF
jgi:hypothetical protein